MKPSGVTAGIITRAAADLIALVCGFGLFFYLSRRLGTVDYGVHSVAFVIGQWFANVLGIFVGPGTVRMVAGHDDGRAYARSMVVVAAAGGVACGAVQAASAPVLARVFDTPELCTPLVVLAFGLPFTTAGNVYSLVLTGQGRHFTASMIGCGYWFCRLAFSVALLEAGWGIAGAAAAISAAEIVRMTTARLKSGIRVVGAAWMPLASLVRHTGLLAGASFAMRVLNQMDLLAVKYVQDDVAAGLYAAAQNVCLLPSTLFQGSSSVVLGSIAAARRRQDAHASYAMVEQYLRIAVLAAGLTAAMVPLAPVIVAFLLGPQFAAAGGAAGFLLVAASFRILAASGRGLAGGYGERGAFVVGLTALAAVAAAAYTWRVPAIAARFAAEGRQPIEAYAAVAAALAAATALGCLMGGVSVSRGRVPWATVGRTLAAAAVAAWVGSTLPFAGVGVFAAVATVAGVYGAVVVILGERVRFVASRSRNAVAASCVVCGGSLADGGDHACRGSAADMSPGAMLDGR